jgi:hypothetical protein
MMPGPVHDVDHWLETNGIKRKWADAILSQAKKEYPHLGQAVHGAANNRAGLDLVLLIHHVLKKRFPVPNSAKRTDSPLV